ncbi:carboxypeptidase A6 isoform X4 [Phoenix dactylifera]|uniref:Carboxypeptidase A6 isoform X4 n=1 Tax=Phoenix dactylifera TaxID=42345 RepID=A0A8B7BLZ6_PHODC|nr:carboxypeptidase A6 isoform X4 [Phoenix dactylifera]
MGFLLLPLYFLSLLLIVFSAAVHGANSSASSMTPIPRDLYHSSGALLNEIEALASRHPDVLTMEKMRADNKGYAAEIVVITYNHVKKQTNNKSKFRILLSFGQHGRELITSEVALHLLSVLAKEQKMLSMQPTSFNKILENIVIKVVPMENLNGRKLVEGGELCERRNGRGVDLNRNWSVDWGKKEKDYDPYEENPGIAPFSEPEAQIMRKLAKSFEPHIWVNVHSGMEALFMPYDHKNSTPNGLTSRLMRYLAHGTTTDYMYDIAKVPMAFTFEIYGDLSASSKDCFKMFNPVDKVTFNRVLNKWVATFLMLFEMVPSRLHSIHLAVSSVKLVPIGGNVVDGSLIGDSRESKKIEGLELGMQELRTYFRLFLLSSVLLMFMFCSRISKSKCRPACPNLAI